MQISTRKHSGTNVMAMMAITMTMIFTITPAVVDSFSTNNPIISSKSLSFTTTTQLYSTDSTPTTTTSTSSPAAKGTDEPTQQSTYGVVEGVELPSTYATCGKCGSSFALTLHDISLEGGGDRGGRRLECGVCGHAWFQSKARLLELSEGYEMIPLPERDMNRIQLNIQQGKSPKFTGDMKLYVGNISFDSSEDDLWELFGSIGNVGDVSLVRDDLGRNRGFAFVTMREKEDSEKALTQLDGIEMNGRSLSVRESNT